MDSRSRWAPGRRLAFERRLRGWTEAELARRVRRLAAYLGQPDPALTAAVVVGWEAGRRLAPARLSLVALVLDIPLADVVALLDPLQLPQSTLAAAQVTGIVEAREMERREFLRLVATAGAVVTFDPAYMFSGVRADRSLVDDLAAFARRLAQQWDSLPPALLHRNALTLLEAVRSLMAGPLAPGLRRNLMAVGGQAGALAGLTARFMGRDHDAVEYLRLAGQLAEGAGESHLQALALVWIADVYSGVQRAGEVVGDPAHVMALLDRAEVLAGPAGPPAVRALVYLRLAEEMAASGEAARAAAWLERADSAFSVAVDPDRTLYGIGWPAETLHPAFRGNVALLAAQPREAVAILENVLGRVPADSTSNRAAAMTDLAAAHARLGELEASTALLAEAWALADGTGLDDRRRRILGVRHRDLEGWADTPAVRDLDERLAAL